MSNINLEKRPSLKFVRPYVDTTYKYIDEKAKPVNNHFGSIDNIVSYHCSNSISFKYDMICLIIVLILFVWFVSTLGVIKM